MTGEKLEWHRVASHLRVPVGELKQRITFSEFLDWLVFLQKERQWHTKQDHYSAQIAAEIRRGQVKNPRRIQLKDFLLKFAEASAGNADRLRASKAVWGMAVGMKLNKD